MVDELEGRIGLITGAGSGIGRETATVFRIDAFDGIDFAVNK